MSLSLKLIKSSDATMERIVKYVSRKLDASNTVIETALLAFHVAKWMLMGSSGFKISVDGRSKLSNLLEMLGLHCTLRLAQQLDETNKRAAASEREVALLKEKQAESEREFALLKEDLFRVMAAIGLPGHTFEVRAYRARSFEPSDIRPVDRWARRSGLTCLEPSVLRSR